MYKVSLRPEMVNNFHTNCFGIQTWLRYDNCISFSVDELHETIRRTILANTLLLLLLSLFHDTTKQSKIIFYPDRDHFWPQNYHVSTETALVHRVEVVVRFEQVNILLSKVILSHLEISVKIIVCLSGAGL